MSLCVTITCARRQTGRSYKVLLGIVLLLGWTSNVDLNPKYTMVEYFAGKAHVSNVFNNSPGHRVASYEINDCEKHGLSQCTRLRVPNLNHAGHTCL